MVLPLPHFNLSSPSPLAFPSFSLPLLGLQGEAGQYTKKVEKSLSTRRFCWQEWEGVHSKCQENMSQVGCGRAVGTGTEQAKKTQEASTSETGPSGDRRRS